MPVQEERTPVFMLTLLACEVARASAASLTDALASGSKESLQVHDELHASE